MSHNEHWHTLKSFDLWIHPRHRRMFLRVICIVTHVARPVHSYFIMNSANDGQIKRLSNFLKKTIQQLMLINLPLVSSVVFIEISKKKKKQELC